LRTIPFSGFGGVEDAFGRRGGHTSVGIGITCLGHCQKGIQGTLEGGWDHEGKEADENCGDLPGWIPFLGMEIRKGKAKPGIHLEALWN
jgi:hypothetical protein